LAHDLDLIAAQVFGGAVGNEGMGLLGFGVDWANITSSPFYLPLSTQISQYFGWGMNYWLLCVCPCIIGSSVLTRLTSAR
jgi:predicted MFS family arabinose efflux permease